jgi:hypothetical protein
VSTGERGKRTILGRGAAVIGQLMSGVVSGVRGMSRLGQVQVGLAVAAVVAALVSSIYLAVSTLSAGQACYGVKTGKNPCSALDAGVVVRLVVVLGIVLALYIGAALLTYALQRASDSFARNTALMFLLMLTALILLMTLAALSGPGFYLLPSLVLLLAAVLVGLAAQMLGGGSAANPR